MDLITQKIAKNLTIAAGATGVIEIAINKGQEAYLQSYGYTYHKDSEYKLSLGQMVFPKRSDQEGSLIAPMTWNNPLLIPPGSKLRFEITNKSTSSLDFDAAFWILTSEMMLIESSGGNIVMETGNDEDDELIQFPLTSGTLLPDIGEAPNNVFTASLIPNKRLIYVAGSIPEGVFLNIYRDSVPSDPIPDLWLWMEDEIGAVEFKNGVLFGTMFIEVTNTTAIDQKWNLKLVFD